MTSNRLLLPALLTLAACGTHSAIEKSQAFKRLADYKRAFDVLEEARKQQLASGGAVDPEIERTHKEAWLTLLLERAREHIFAERLDEALADLDALEALAPNYPELGKLRERSRYKKALKAVQLGDEKLARKDYAAALAHYLECERVFPGIAESAQGLKRVEEQLALLSGRAQHEFLEALRKVPELRHYEVQWHAANVVKNTPLPQGNESRAVASGLEARARHENALKALERGRLFVKSEHYGAALMEFKNAQRLDPTLPGIDAEIARMDSELKVLAQVDKAQKEMRNGRFDAAQQLLKEAFDASVVTRGHISELMLQVRTREGATRYQAARDLELLGKKAEALAAFSALQKDWPEGVADEAVRIDSLRVDINGAETEWAAAVAAEKAGDLAAALDHYLNSERFYAGWKDGKARIESLRKKLSPPDKTDGRRPGS